MDLDLGFCFKMLVGFTIIQRIAELFWAKRNENLLVKKGAKIINETNYLFMVVLHSSWLVSLAYFAFFEKLQFSNTLFLIGLIVFIIGQGLRISAIYTLGERWSTRIVILAEAPAIKKGLFKFVKHPNYLGVILEIVALPFCASLYEVAIIFTLTNFVILYFRIKKEESELSAHNNYQQIFYPKVQK
jgi:methyltransferase